MGDIGGNAGDYTVSQERGNFTIGNANCKGKFADEGDGFAAVFVQIDAGKNFTASARIKIKSLAAGVTKQSGFGVMLRDDIYIDTDAKAILSNFVAAGALCGGGGAIFAHESSRIKRNESNTINIARDAEYTASVTRLGQVVTVTFADGANTYTKIYTDFDFTAIDNDYMYLCLFANRGITAEFSNISFTIDGDAQGA
jgi:hypothetical protein